MYMFETFLKSIPKNRSEFVNDLEIPEVTLTPYVWTDLDSPSTRSTISIVSLNVTEEIEDKSLNTESSVALTRAMTDSDIDYDRYKRFKHRRYSDPWDLMKAANKAFPTSYLDSLYSYLTTSDYVDSVLRESRLHRYEYNEKLRQRMKKYFDEECNVFTSDDTGLTRLEEALLDLDYKTLYPYYTSL